MLYSYEGLKTLENFSLSRFETAVVDSLVQVEVGR